MVGCERQPRYATRAPAKLSGGADGDSTGRDRYHGAAHHSAPEAELDGDGLALWVCDEIVANAKERTQEKQEAHGDGHEPHGDEQAPVALAGEQ